MTDLNPSWNTARRPRILISSVAGVLFFIGFHESSQAVVFVERSAEAVAGAAGYPSPFTLARPGVNAQPLDGAEFHTAGLDSQFAGVSLSGVNGASVSFGLALAGIVRSEESATLKGARLVLGGGAVPRGMQHLESIASGPFEPVAGNLTELATFGSKTTGSPVLNVPAPGALPSGAPAKDNIPEPGTIGFGLAIIALGLSSLARSFMRCWRMTSVRGGGGGE